MQSKMDIRHMAISGKPVLPYLAGIVDGEGTIQVHVPVPSKRSYFSAVYISNTHKPMLEMLQKECGGFILGPYQYDIKCKPQFRLVWHGKSAKPILEALLTVPWFIVKRKQAELALLFENMRTKYFRADHGRRGYEAYIRQEFLRIRDEIKHLNKRGPVAASETKPESGLQPLAVPANDSPTSVEIR